MLGFQRDWCRVSASTQYHTRTTLVILMLPLPYKIHIGSVRVWNQTLDYLRWDLFSQQERLAKGCYMKIVCAGELFVVAVVELRCIIAQPSANVPKCGFGPVQEHLYDLAPYWTGIATDIWQGEPLLIALYLTDNPIQISTVQLFNNS